MNKSANSFDRKGGNPQEDAKRRIGEGVKSFVAMERCVKECWC